MVTLVVLASSVTCLLGAATSLRKALPGLAELVACAVTALAVLAQSVVAGTRMLGGYHPAEQATTIGYLIGIVLVMPLATAWAYAERVRTSGYVIAVAAFTCAVMTARLLMLWNGGHV
jgi:hypothetical protein